VPDVVARLIHAMLGELHGETAAGGAMEAGKKSFDHTLRDHFEPAQLRNLEGIEQIEPDTAG
jgi:hypothetical protein